MGKTLGYGRKGSISEKVTGDYRSIMMIGSILKAVMLTGGVFVLMAYLLTHTEFSENLISPVSIVTSMLSCFMIGYDFSKRNKERGLIYGGLGGFTYVLIYILISTILAENIEINTKTIMVLVFGVLGGSLGGVFGVNKR